MRPMMSWSLLLLCCCIAGVAYGVPHGRYSQQSSRFTKPYNICTSDWSPMVMCEQMDNPKDFTGYQVALWREMAKDLGLQEDTDWVFTCVDWNSMIDDLMNPNGSCSMAAAGVEVITENIMLGLKFSWPVYKSGFRILVATTTAGGTWSFTEAFDLGVWVLLGATSLAVAALITMFDLVTYGTHASQKGFRGWVWYSTAKLVQVYAFVGDPRTWASKVMVLGYAFLTLIMVHLYTATTATIMTVERLTNDIKSVHDLAGKKVETWEGYMAGLRKMSTEADPLPWDDNNDTRKFVDNLRSHKHQALVLDSATIMDLAAHAEHCDLFPVGSSFQTFELAIGFSPDAPSEFVGNVSASILRLQTTRHVLDELENVFMMGDTTGQLAAIYGPRLAEIYGGHVCPDAFQDDGSGHQSAAQIRFSQVSGVWYVLLITLGMAVLLTAINQVRHYCQKQAQRAAIVPAAQELSQPGHSRVQPSSPGSTADTVFSYMTPQMKVRFWLSWLGGGSSSGTAAGVSSSNNTAVSSDCVAEVSLPPGALASYTGTMTQQAGQLRSPQSPVVVDAYMQPAGQLSRTIPNLVPSAGSSCAGTTEGDGAPQASHISASPSVQHTYVRQLRQEEFLRTQPQLDNGAPSEQGITMMVSAPAP